MFSLSLSLSFIPSFAANIHWGDLSGLAQLAGCILQRTKIVCGVRVQQVLSAWLAQVRPSVGPIPIPEGVPFHFTWVIL